ncbi:L,D-transpeptidase family protein [Sphingomonas changbaiensis]|nr:L,D-transpeptidase family protein [Sphingomonas changbaiensis]
MPVVAAPQLPPEAADIHFVDRALWPDPRWSDAEIRTANPLYAALESRLRSASAEDQAAIAHDLRQLRLIGPAERFVLVDIASGRLWMIGEGRVAGTMKVVTGKPGMDTPKMAALIRYAVLNPYWNVPPDLVRDRVAEHVLPDGPGWLRRTGLEPVASYAPDAPALDPEAVDWTAVAAGDADVGLRQEPGPYNVMGRVKFMFPNNLGIYLHDTPDTRLFRAASRRFSSGCVRLEHAAVLYRWLFGGQLPAPDPHRPEQRVALPRPVPVYILDLPTLARDAPQVAPLHGHQAAA